MCNIFCSITWSRYKHVERLYLINYRFFGLSALFHGSDNDFFKAFSSIDGFEFIEELDMSFNKKQYGKQYNDEKGVIKNSEPIMVFKKVK